VAVNSKGNTLAIQKDGQGGILPTTLQVMLQTARKIGVDMITSLDQAIDQDREILKSNLI
jgi:exosome complex RNA-binding protein Rrp42 (RNase PH superfamily)